MNKRAWIALTLLALAPIWTQGCRSSGANRPPAHIVRGPVPAYATVAAAYNARVANLDRLACPVSVVVHTKNEQGNPLREQVEGNLQLALPSNVALRLDKVGQTVFYLGSNATKYWWFDLTNQKTALVGAHDKATPQAVENFGIPVHPLDLLECLAISPVPAAGAEQATHAKLEWSKDGHNLILTLPGRWQGHRRFFLDPATYDPSRVELLDKAGALQVAANLSRYNTVEVAGNTRVHPRIAGRFDVEIPAQQATAEIGLVRPTNPGPAQKPKLFDLDFLLTYYRIQKVIDVDQPRANAAQQAEGIPAK